MVNSPASSIPAHHLLSHAHKAAIYKLERWHSGHPKYLSWQQLTPHREHVTARHAGTFHAKNSHIPPCLLHGSPVGQVLVTLACSSHGGALPNVPVYLHGGGLGPPIDPNSRDTGTVHFIMAYF